MRLRNRIASFVRSRQASTGVMFGLAFIPVVFTIGAGLDYSNAARIRTRLDVVADTAALAAVSQSQNPTLAAPTDVQAKAMFTDAVSHMSGVTLTNVTVTSSPSITGLVVTVSYTADVKTIVSQAVHINTLAIGGSAVSTRNFPSYVDFYLLLDNSPSMGLAATTDDITKLQSLTPDSCAFACHKHTYDKNGKVTGDDLNDYYHIAKNNSVTLRIDVLRTATQKLTTTGQAWETLPNQIRMGVYTFSDALQTISGLTSDLSLVASQANAIDLAYAYQDQRDDQTSYDIALPAINAIMTDPGNGKTSSTPLKYLFLVTDGVQDEDVTTVPSPKPSGNVSSSRLINNINPALCTTIKNRGIRIAVLYTTYLPVTNNAFYNKWVAPISSKIPTTLESCASPGFYFEVSPSGGIEQAMVAMFQAALSQARLTQ